MKRLRFAFCGWAVLVLAPGPISAAEAPLADATERKNSAAVRVLLEQKADVNGPQADGMTALHWATYHDDLDTVKRLIVAGADAKAANRYGVAPLALACTNGNTAIVQFLLDSGGDPKTAPPTGRTAAMTATPTRPT